MARKYLIETYGCQMNVHDSERMAGLLEQAGFEATVDDRDADVVVINTCSVRERAEEKLFTRLGEFRQMALEEGERPVVAVAGCVAQQEGEKILGRSNAVDVVIGTQNLKRLPMLVTEAVERPRSGASRPVIDIDPIEDVSFPLGIARRPTL
jgi:tRNA-2-methylthio-N6-dimethylallyladenosine synthase